MPYDNYGRHWHFEHDWPTDHMLKISDDLAAAGYNFDRALRGAKHTYADLLKDCPHEPYLLRCYRGGEWVMGVRYGDKPSDYDSPGLDPLIVAKMVEAHCASATGPLERRAIAKLTPPPSQLREELMAGLRRAPW